MSRLKMDEDALRPDNGRAASFIPCYTVRLAAM
ncbi:hypothetical protein CFU_0103 [Collimonas fungivorans Ter331]|uniref:Uncharacterized protein n=1 Tax=Collimonas fungivorans (strain Ter331) TaxID=1005048 RepID=G0AG50_COLFT|nr:hypothetical protein CFU_0103 [Collimonas fungivorans Ter331]